MDAAITGTVSHAIRAAEPDDIAFIVKSWAQSFWQESTWANRVTWQVFKGNEDKPGHEAVIEELIKRSAVLVACDPEDPSSLAGYFVFEPRPRIAHWVYVKPAFRKLGIARALLAASGLPHDLRGVTVTHITRAWCTVKPLRDSESGQVIKPARVGLEEKFSGFIHDPYQWLIMKGDRGHS